jgi:hypothetical protein
MNKSPNKRRTKKLQQKRKRKLEAVNRALDRRAKPSNALLGHYQEGDERKSVAIASLTISEVLSKLSHLV